MNNNQEYLKIHIRGINVLNITDSAWQCTETYTCTCIIKSTQSTCVHKKIKLWMNGKLLLLPYILHKHNNQIIKQGKNQGTLWF